MPTHPAAMSELLPCPFCGGDAEEKDGYPLSIIACSDCGARTMANSLENAKSLWQNRPDASLSAASDRVKKNEG